MGVYLRAEFEVSSIILQVLDRLEGGGGGPKFDRPPPTSKRTPKKPTHIRVKAK